MSPARPLWRSLLTAFQIVALVAFSILGAGHSHADAGHARHAAMTTPDLQEVRGADHGSHASHQGEQAGDADAAGPCGMTCCGHAPFVRWNSVTLPVSWKPGQILTGARDVAFDSVPSERLAEPPRTFA